MKCLLSVLVAFFVLLCCLAEAQKVGAPLSQTQVQELMRLRNLPDCTRAGIKTIPHVFQAPDHVRIAAFDYVNTTVIDCALRPNQGVELELLPGHTAHSSYRWSTQPSSSGADCHESQGISDFGVLLVSRTLLSRVCSEVQYRAYFPGRFVPDWKALGSEPEALPPAPVVTASKSAYYDGEHIDMRVRLSGVPADNSCPTLLETVRDVHGFTRIDEIVSCHDRSAPQGPPNEFTVDVGEGTRWDGLGDRTFIVSELAGIAPDGEVRLVPSNPITLHIADPSEIKRDWGPMKDGVRADLAVDKLAYAVGQDVPLHIALENVSATRKVYGEPFRPRPAFGDYSFFSVKVTVQGADGALTPQLDNFPATISGPLLCPPSYLQGKPVYMEKSLRQLGLLPDKPGTYKIVVTWSPYTTDIQTCNAVPRFDPAAPPEKPFVSVMSTPVFLQVEDDSSWSKVPSPRLGKERGILP